jgi:dTDP-4-dehydrorhamnose reductase
LETRLRVLVTGGSSFLGRRLVPLATVDHDVRYTFFSRDPLGLPGGMYADLRERHEVFALVRNWSPDVIVHLAGSNTSPDMDAVIRRGAENVAAVAEAEGARLLFLSTDVIFDGREGPYAETDCPRPLHDYGRAKSAAEACAAAVPNHVVVRTSLIYDLEIVVHHLAWLIDGLRRGQRVTLFTDQLRNPIWTMTLSQALLELARTSYCGTLHVAGREALSRSAFGLALLDWWGVPERKTLELAPGDGERWPADCRLSIARATALLETPLLGVSEVLAAARAGRCADG